MLTVHHLNNSRSQRILWMLEELGVPYEVKRYQRLPSMMAPPELKAVHPLGKSPVITDGDKTLAESGAIIEYLGDAYGHGKLTPALGTPERLHYTYFMHYAEGSLMPLLFMKLVFGRIPARLPFFFKPVGRAIVKGANSTLLDPQIGNHFMFLESELSKREWFAGASFTPFLSVLSYKLRLGVLPDRLRAGLIRSSPMPGGNAWRPQTITKFSIRASRACSTAALRWKSCSPDAAGRKARPGSPPAAMSCGPTFPTTACCASTKPTAASASFASHPATPTATRSTARAGW